MGILVPDDAKQVMENTQLTTSGSKIERRVIEKNRRNHMKILYSQLNSLLPNQHSKEPVSLPEQIDEAINYIKTLESNMQKLKQKRDNLKIGRKRSYELCSSSSSTRSAAATSTAKSPQIQIHEIGSTLEVVLSTGLHNQFIFYDIIRILDQEQADVVHASFSASGDSILHLVRAEMGNLILDFGAAKITEKLKRIVYGSASDEELQHDDHNQDYYLWDFQIHPQMWDF
ncbi:PREDICTED: transcription factor bHLH118-like isoform X2 [Fragaria vesca subsp. vesca]|uniref:transcription factor bHLH118-like isoform X2 n=1 Tax=Fragaria vesca subsp. vesca TaxID=101020 RepID=UPI0002C32DCF|nr:PREDICTED: transcription factor bHLH118-like isoform X2 [Fragaria vesca subsp. vesca]